MFVLHSGDDILERDGSKESGEKKDQVYNIYIMLVRSAELDTRKFGSTYCCLAPNVFTQKKNFFSLLYLSLSL